MPKLGDTLTPLALASVGQLRLSDVGELKPLAVDYLQADPGDGSSCRSSSSTFWVDGRVMQVTLFSRPWHP